jgi:hypothetical protein
LHDAPLARGPLLDADEEVDQLRPGDSGLDLDLPALAVERKDAIHRASVEQRAARCELLAAHGVAAAGEGDGTGLVASVADRCPKRGQRADPRDAGHVGGVQTRVDVIDHHGRV